ncbi:BatA domain-containing protein [bacterium]|nr:BatA domain-containing protein [bacterium]MBU1065859.1 BatA domain-containing protein [bacterium]MBU1634182.1 BatA domain-containing protein [bacterium]MBU1872801.1 BatA domain-containing protein [bacterium]
MSFINSFFLYLLPLVAVPIVIHLIGRQRYYKQEFSTLRFLKQLEIELVRKLKIRQILLLVLRILLILLLILVFARPYRTTRSPGIVVGKGETLYLIVDNSLSMQARMKGKSRLEIAKSSVLSAAEQIDYPVYIKLIESTHPQKIKDIGLVTDPSLIEDILTNVDAANGNGSINRAIVAVQTDLKLQRELNPAIWILSDFQKPDFQRNPSVDEFFKTTDSRVILFPVSSNSENVAISSLSVPGQLFRQNQAVQVRGFLSNWNSEAVEAPVSLFLGDQKLGQALLTVPPFKEAHVRFEFIPSSPGFHQARLKIADDNLLMDNQRYFPLNIPDQIRVLIVSRHPEDSRYIKRALGADEASVVIVKMTSTSLFSTEDLAQYDLLVFSNVDELADNAQTKLNFYLEMNRGLLLFPGKDCSPEKFNALWARTYGFPKWRTTRTAEPGQYLKSGNIDANHPVFSRLLREKDSFEYSPEYYTIQGFSISKNHRVLATYEDNTPLIMEATLDAGRGILLASAPVAGWSNLQLTGFFPAIMNRLVFYLAQQGMPELDIVCGDTLIISPSKLNIRTDLSVHTPDNRRIKLALGIDDPILFNDTEIPGFYELYSEGRKIKQYAVNVPESEASASFLSMPDFEELLSDYPGKMDVFLIGEEKDLNRLEHSREFSDWLIAMVLIVALLESYIGRINRKIKGKLKNG